MVILLKKKAPLTCSVKRANKNALDSTLFCQGRIISYPRYHLDSQPKDCALSRVQAYPRKLTYSSTLQNTGRKFSFAGSLHPQRPI